MSLLSEVEEMKNNSIKKIRKRKRIIFVILLVAVAIAGCKNGTKTDEPDKPVISITNPKPCHTGRIIVYEQGEMVFDYYGDINLINDGRNGEEIVIIVGESNQ